MHAAMLFLAALAPVETPKDQDAKGVLEKLQGVWKLTAVDPPRGRFDRGGFAGGAAGGAPGPAGPARLVPASPYGDTLVIVGSRYAFGSNAGRLKLDLSRRPYAVDFEITGGHYKGETVRAIFDVTGDTLQLTLPTITHARTRPKSLKPDEGARNILHTLKRDAKATPAEAAALLADEVSNLPRPPDSVVANELLQKIVDRLDRLEQIEKRLQEIEKRLPGEKK